MTVAEIRTLFTYNHWANRRLLTAARNLSDEELTRDLRSSYASVRGTFVHIIGGHWVWLRLWLGEPAKEIAARCDAVWDPEKFPDVASLETAHTALEEDQVAFNETLTDDQLNARRGFESFQGRPLELSLGEMMQHVVNHSTYHRGQVVTLLRQLDQVPPGTDLSTFFTARP